MYIDAYLNKNKDEIWVSERINEERITNVLPTKYTLYYEDRNGTYETIFGDKVKKFTTEKSSVFYSEKKKLSDRKIFESDINPITRVLEENYLGLESPKLNIGFFDIEVDFDNKHGFSSPDDAFNKITAITTYISSIKKLVTLAIPPNSIEEPSELIKDFDNTFLFKKEEDLLKNWLELIEDVDVLSGWNSTGYDIPYTINRIKKVLGKTYTKKMCLWDLEPKKRTYMKFKKEHHTYDLIGRIHLDYLELFQKHSTQRYHSYKLDFIGEIVVGEKKTEYNGTLDELYNKDFKKFIEYNRQDVELLVKIDEKMKYIDLANKLAHDNSVLITSTMGSVALIEQAVINEAHRRNLVVMDKNVTNKEHIPIAGAYVAEPKIGLHNWIGSVDINSLYPSVIRSLNMGPETIVGQIRSTDTENYIKERLKIYETATESWHDMFNSLEYDYVMNKDDITIILDMEDGESIELKAYELYNYIFNSDSNICISANGTLFRTDIKGVIPGLLEKWYNERLEMKKIKSDYSKIQKGIEIDSELEKMLNE